MHCAQLSRREKAKNGLGKVKLEKKWWRAAWQSIYRRRRDRGEVENKKLTALKLTQGNREAWLGWW